MIAQRRHLESFAGVSTPAISSATSTTGNSKVTPKATISSRISCTYEFGDKMATIVLLGPLTSKRKRMAWGKVR